MKIHNTRHALPVTVRAAKPTRRRCSVPLETWYKGLSPSQVDPTIRNHIRELEQRVVRFGRIDGLRSASGLAMHLLVLTGFASLLIFSAFKISLGLAVGATFGFVVLGLFSGFLSYLLIADLMGLVSRKPVFLPHREEAWLTDDEARLLFQVFRNYSRVVQHAQYGADFGQYLRGFDQALVDFIRFETFDAKAFQ